MHIKISTRVESPLPEVRAGFTEDLFMSLNPPFPPVKLQEFGGCETGDRVALELNFLLFRQQWVSDITHHEESDQKWLFVDEGTKLPFFLKTWQHRHLVEARAEGSEIIDDIRFTTGTLLTDLLMYPALLLQFIYRKHVYKKVFKK